MFLSNSSTSPVEVQGLDLINQAFNVVIRDFQTRLDAATARANEVGFTKIDTTIEDCVEIGKLYSPSSYLRMDYRERTADELKICFEGLLSQARAIVEEKHARNLPKIEANKVLKAKLTALLESLGFKPTYQERETSGRSMKVKWVTKTSGYVETLTKIVNNGDVDGRYFRDSEYGIDFCFGKAAEANEMLVKDYNTLVGMIPQF